jgi:hypothetical protein
VFFELTTVFQELPVNSSGPCVVFFSRGPQDPVVDGGSDDSVCFHQFSL